MPLFVLEQIDPVRVFVGVPELASYFVHEQDTALIRFQAIPGVTREGKVVRSGFSLNPATRTLQTEIDIPNNDGHLRPGWYVTVTIAVERKQVWALPSNAIGYQGGQNYSVYLDVAGKPVRTQVLIGPSDDTTPRSSRSTRPPPIPSTGRIRRHRAHLRRQPRRPGSRGGRRPGWAEMIKSTRERQSVGRARRWASWWPAGRAGRPGRWPRRPRGTAPRPGAAWLRPTSRWRRRWCARPA